jgi:diguanylate cyclase (GGDEF)-like protein
MKVSMFERRGLFASCAVIVVAQSVILRVDPTATFISNVFVSISVFLACLGCLKAGHEGSPKTRRLWFLFGSAFFLSMIGQVASTYHELTTHNAVQNNAFNFDFLFFAYGIPLLLAICSDAESSGLKIFLWLDGVQALVAAMLAYLQLFSTLPSFVGWTAISAIDLFYINNAENVILVGAVTLRLLSNPRPDSKRFYQAMAIYLWVYALVALVVGYLELARAVPSGLHDVGWTIPYLTLLGVLAFRPIAPRETDALPGDNRSIRLLINNLSPVIFTLAIVLMGIEVAGRHPWLALACISMAVASYGLRAALLQGKYLKSQAELTETAFSLIRANDQLMSLSTRDGLTEIYNRRYFDEMLKREWKVAVRSKQALSLLMIDVDCFKQLNDLYGHQMGDQCLRSIAADLRARLKRPSDLLARYGGEEFAVILPGSDLEGALFVAEEIRLSIARLGLPNEASIVQKIVTVSIGVSSKNLTEADHAEELIKRADVALYLAKTGGRNQSHFTSSPAGPDLCEALTN